MYWNLWITGHDRNVRWYSMWPLTPWKWVSVNKFSLALYLNLSIRSLSLLCPSLRCVYDFKKVLFSKSLSFDLLTSDDLGHYLSKIWSLQVEDRFQWPTKTASKFLINWFHCKNGGSWINKFDKTGDLWPLEIGFWGKIQLGPISEFVN